ncbi:substrate-binding domain-containing protein [Saccharobesus litoralis]|nr:substrate-binding domain-containing protein [Saccharobesus litoralis]
MKRITRILLSYCIYLVSGLLAPSLLAQTSAQAQPEARALLFVNADEKNAYWQRQVGFAQAVALSFNIELVVEYISPKVRAHLREVEHISKTLDTSQVKFDYVISTLPQQNENALLQALEKRQIPLLSIKSNLSQLDNQVSSPRQAYPLWLGHITIDDVYAGFVAAKQLINHAAKHTGCKPAECRFNLMAISGEQYSPIAQQREAGLRRALKYSQQVNLVQTINSDWSPESAYGLMNQALQKNSAELFWVADADIARATVTSLGYNNFIAGEHALVGAIGWSNDVVDLIEFGNLEFSLGGDFMLAGWALILMTDYLSGRDFKQDSGVLIKTKLSKLDRSSLYSLGQFIKQPEWQEGRLRSFAKRYNPNLKRYLFSAEHFIRQAGVGVNP